MGLSSKHQVIDSDYLLCRAEAEVALAEEAANEKAAQTHHNLASAYFDKLFADRAGTMSERSRREIIQENRAAVTSVFGHWRVERQDASLQGLLQVLEARTSR